MRERWALLLAILMLTSPASALVAVDNPQMGGLGNHDYVPVDSLSNQSIGAPNSPWIESRLFDRIDSGNEDVRVTVITRSLSVLNQWQYNHGAIEEQKPANSGESIVSLDPACLLYTSPSPRD